MATSSVDLLSVISGIQVSSSDILQAELLLSQVLTAQDPTIDIRVGTAVRDLAIRPNATLLATINKALVYYWAQNSLVNVDDTTPTIFVDKILQNFFMTRFTGANAIITAKLYFAKQVSITLTTDMFFSTDNVLLFNPIVSSTYSAGQLVFDPTSNQFYLTVQLQAAQAGTQYNITSGSLIYFSNFNPYFLHAEISYLTSIAANPETNTQFIARAKTAISTRNLINTPSIISNLQNNFSLVSQVVPLGYGDAGMIRDKIIVYPPAAPFNGTTPVWTHVGGHTDIYVNVPLTTSLLQFAPDTTGSVTITGAVYNVAVSSTPGGANVDTIIPTTPNLNIVSTSENWLTTSLVSTALVASNGTPTNIITITATNHGLELNERITISGASQALYNGTFQITSVPDANTFTYNITSTAAANTFPITLTKVDRANDLGFSNSQVLKVTLGTTPITISTLTWSGGIATVTTSVAHGYSTGWTVNVAGVASTTNAYNGNWIVVSTGTNTFTFTVANDGVATTTYALVKRVFASYNTTPLAISSVTWLSNVVTVTTPVAHGYTTGQSITIAGTISTTNAYNGTWTIVSVSTYTFTFASTTNDGVVGVALATVNSVMINSVSLNLSYFQDVDGIQVYLQDPANRVLSVDQLARGFNISVLTISVVGYGAVAPNSTICTNVINKYLASLQPGQSFIMADLLSGLYAAGITTIQTPLSVSYIKYWRDLMTPTTGSTTIITDAHNPNDPTNIFVLGTLNTPTVTTITT
jgi:hypothetical protein